MSAVDEWLNQVDPRGDDVPLSGLTGEQESTVVQVLATLRAELATAFGTVSGTFAAFGAGSSQDAVIKNLQDDGKRIDKLATEQLNEARAGTLAFSSWCATATLVHNDIAYQSGLTSDWSMASVIKNAAGATAEDVKQVADQVKDTVANVGGGFGVGAALGLAFAAYVWWKAR